MSKKVRDEHQEQVRFVSAVRCFYPQVLIFAVPNGGKRDPKEAKRLVDEGVKAGVSDLFVAEAREGYNGLFIEMKRSKGGKVSEKQENFMEAATARGYKCIVSYGAEEAFRDLQYYIGVSDNDRVKYPGEK
jgi:hypothetical protein